MTEIFHWQALVHCAYRDGNHTPRNDLNVIPCRVRPQKYLVLLLWEIKSCEFDPNKKQNEEIILLSVNGFLTDSHFFQTSTFPIRLKFLLLSWSKSPTPVPYWSPMTIPQLNKMTLHWLKQACDFGKIL